MTRSQLLLCAVTVAAALAPSNVVLDGASAYFVFDGIGGLSAGASSRLLRDYSAAHASDILDFLYKPSFGAALHICKVEIGGDCQSTDGTEPSHKHNASDLSCRGYEFELMREAKARNAAVLLYGLSWGVPAWVGQGSFFSADNIAYQVAFADCVRESVDAELDYIGIWNERSWGSPAYVKGLRAALDAAGHTATKIILPDDNTAVLPILAAAAADAAFDAAFTGIGLHYKHDAPQPEVAAAHKTYWNSEDFSQSASSWSAGASTWASALVRNFVNNNMTATIAWSTIWHYNVSAPIWVSAHVAQFAQPGWRYLSVGAGSGVLLSAAGADVGAFVTLVPPSDLSGVSLVVETIGRPASTPTFRLTGNLPGAGTVLHVWQTTEDALFVELPAITVAGDGTFALPLPADGVITASTVSTARHGAPSVPIPASAPLALPYTDSFDGAAWDSLPRFLSDQGGSFAVRDGVLQQVVMTDPGRNGWVASPDPITLLGDGSPWADVTVAVTVTLPSSNSSSSSAGGGPGSSEPPTAHVATCAVPGSAAAATQVWAWDVVSAGYLSNTVGGVPLCLDVNGCNAALPLILYECVTSGGTCCGELCYAGLRFNLSAAGALTSPLFSARCAAVGGGGVLTMVACDGSPSQAWAWDPSTGALRSAATGECLDASGPPPPPPPPPPPAYASVCARVTKYSGFAGKAPVPGVCLKVESTGRWAVLAGGSVLGNGTLPGFALATPHRLSVSTQGAAVSASVDGAALGSFAAGAYTGGMVSFGCGYHAAAFDDFALSSSPPREDSTPSPEPPVPAPSSGWASANVFWRGQQASDGTVYPCVRIPSVLQAGGGVLLAFAECRRSTGDGCFPDNVTAHGGRDVCMRRSTDAGRTWGALTVVAPGAGQDTAVYDSARGAVVLNVNLANTSNAQLVSRDDGASWGPARPLAPFLEGLDGADAGPGVGLQLSPSNPHHPGRLLFIGHRGAYVEDAVWFSDDGGATYAVARTPSGHTLLRMDEAQLVELWNGDVLASMRNNVPQAGGGHLRAVALSTDGGATFTDPAFDPALPEPVCMASVLRAAPPRGDGSLYFANPGQATGRVNGRVRRSRACTGATCAWDAKSLVVAQGAPYGYSCLAPLNTTHMGLLWETGAPGCSASSSACLLVFSTIPLSDFD